MSRVLVVALVVIGAATLGCGDDDFAEEPQDHESIGICFAELPDAAEVFSPRKGNPCESASFQVFAAVRPNEGEWPGEDEERLSEDEGLDHANEVRAACRAVIEQQFDAPDAKVFGYSTSVRSEWDRADGTALCVTTPPIMDAP